MLYLVRVRERERERDPGVRPGTRATVKSVRTPLRGREDGAQLCASLSDLENGPGVLFGWSNFAGLTSC